MWPEKAIVVTPSRYRIAAQPVQKHDIESEQIAITVDSLQCDSRDGASNADCEPMLYNISFGNISFGLAGATRAMVHKQAQWAPLE
jgi:hypothetical protein